MSRNRLLRSSGFRTGLLYTVLFTLSVLVLLGVVYWQTAGYMEKQLRDVINADIQSLHVSYHQEGIAGLRRAIEDRLHAAHGNTSRFVLLDAKGNVVAGNLTLPVSDIQIGWAELQLPGPSLQQEPNESEDSHIVLGRGLDLENGDYLFVGQDAHQLDELRELLFSAFFWVSAVTLLLSGIGGAIMGRRTLHQIDAINRVAGEIVQGNLTHRIPARGTGDEFDILTEHLNRMLERIEALMEGMRQVTNDIAHDLRTPLGRLRQKLDSARRNAATVEAYQQAVDTAIDETDEILGTFGALLRIAQIESGSRRARFATVDLAAILDTVLEVYEPVAEEDGYRLTGKIEAGIQIRGDRDLLVQLFANLIENSLRHTPKGSHIEVTLQGHARAIEVAVADNGPGIPEHARDKVRQRFYRLESSRSTPGSGLGMSLVAAIAELHSASLTLSDNAPGLRVGLQFNRA